MWVVYFNGRAYFCLLGGLVYTIGKKDCDIIIQDDASISRRHLILEVGLRKVSLEEEKELDEQKDEAEVEIPPLEITLTDTSTYGTEVCPSSSQSDNSENNNNNNITKATRALQLCRRTPLRKELAKGETFSIPLNDILWHAFIIHLGTHGAELHLRWSPLRVFAVRLSQENDVTEAEERVKLGNCLKHCGGKIVTNFHYANYLVTSQLTPTPAAMAMLCRAAHIVTPAYFEILCGMNSSNINSNNNNSERNDLLKGTLSLIPDPLKYAPPLDDFWATLWESNETVMEAAKISELLLLNPINCRNRQKLFSGLTFVTVQPSLYEEVSCFLPYAEGKVVLDESLREATTAEGERREEIFTSFYTNHSKHIVVYNNRERLPFRFCMKVLQEHLKLCCVEYLELVKSIAHASSLKLHALPDNLKVTKQKKPQQVKETEDSLNEKNEIKRNATTERIKRKRDPKSPNGRRTDPNPLFSESLSDAEMERREKREIEEQKIKEIEERQQKGETEGWVRREPTTVTDEKDLVISGPSSLPNYPCFQPYHYITTTTTNNNNNNLSSSNSKNVINSVLGGKCFKKQHLLVSNEEVELDRSSGVPVNPVLTKTRAIDSDDIIPDVIENTTRISGTHFNVFDATAHHQHHRSSNNNHNKITAARRRAERREAPVSVSNINNTSNHINRPIEVAKSGTFYEKEEDGEISNDNTNSAVSSGVISREKTGGDPVNIFDLDGLF